MRSRSVLAVACLALAACAPKTIVRTETVEVPVYVRQSVDRVLTEPRTCARPPMQCQRKGEPRYCNGQLLAALQCHERALEESNADKAAIRKGAD